MVGLHVHDEEVGGELLARPGRVEGVGGADVEGATSSAATPVGTAVDLVHREEDGGGAGGGAQEVAARDAERACAGVGEVGDERLDLALLGGRRDRLVLAVGDHLGGDRQVGRRILVALALGDVHETSVDGLSTAGWMCTGRYGARPGPGCGSSGFSRPVGGGPRVSARLGSGTAVG